MFHQAKSKNDLSVVFSDLFINDVKTKIENSLKFLGVMIDQNVTWKTHVKSRKPNFKECWNFF